MHLTRHRTNSGRRTRRPLPTRTAGAPLATLLALAATLSCGESGTEPGGGASSVAVSPATVQLTALGDTVRLTAQVRHWSGDVITGAHIWWSSSDTTVATVDDSGLATALANGTATITASAGTASGTAALTVVQAPHEVVVTPSADTLVAFGDTVRLEARATDANGHAIADAAFTWASTDTSVAKVDASGLVESLAQGTATVTATASGATGAADVRVVLPPPAAVVATPDTVTFNALGETVQLEAQVLDQGGRPIAGITVAWSGGDRLVATVDSDGIVTAVGAGVTTVTAAAGSASDSVQVVVSDRAVLAAFYHATDGPNWLDNTNWLTDAPLGDWYGVRTNTEGRVVSLYLVRHGLSGEIPPELGSLSSLSSLSLGQNDLSGDIPPELGSLSSLSSLNLSGNDLSGEIPPWLGSLSSLVHLYLFDNDLSGEIPPELGSLSSLSVLGLSGNYLSGEIPPELGSLSSLEWLYLSGNDLSGVIPPELGSLSSLEHLDLHQNDLSGAIPPELASLSSLLSLGLSQNDLSGAIPPELGSLSSLVALSLSYNDLSGEIPPELGSLSGLSSLGLSGNDLSGEIPPWLGSLSSLGGLFLSGNDLSGEIPPELGSLSSLVHLYLGDNHLSGAIPPKLGSLSSLVYLHLGDNDLSGEIPPWLGSLSSLVYLHLGDNDLSGAIPPELGSLSSLVYLYLHQNDLSGAIPPELGSLSSLEHLHLGDNDLSGAIPPAWVDLELASLMAADTDLCVPRGGALEDWLATIPRRRIAWCGELPAVYMVQAVQSRAHPVPLVGGEDALLRVFVTAARETTERIPPVRARFYLNGIEHHVADVPAGSAAIPTEIDEGVLSKSANAVVPAQVVQPGLEMVIEVDPGGTLDASLGVPTRMPAEGRLAVEVHDMPDLDLTVIPFLWSSDPDSAIIATAGAMAEDPGGHPLLEDTRILLPVAGIDVTAHAPVATYSNRARELFFQTEAIRVLEGHGGHYIGMMSGSVTGADVAFVPGRSSFSIPNSDVIAHGLGHNMYLWHAPCGGAANPDPSFPDPGGAIGAWGLRR